MLPLRKQTPRKQPVWLYMIRQACEWQMRKFYTLALYSGNIGLCPLKPILSFDSANPSRGPFKRWVWRMLSEMLPLRSGLWWTWNDFIDPTILLGSLRPAENAALSHSHFQKSKVSRGKPFWKQGLFTWERMQLWKCCSFYVRPVELCHQDLF